MQHISTSDAHEEEFSLADIYSEGVIADVVMADIDPRGRKEAVTNDRDVAENNMKALSVVDSSNDSTESETETECRSSRDSEPNLLPNPRTNVETPSVDVVSSSIDSSETLPYVSFSAGNPFTRPYPRNIVVRDFCFCSNDHIYDDDFAKQKVINDDDSAGGSNDADSKGEQRLCSFCDEYGEGIVSHSDSGGSEDDRSSLFHRLLAELKTNLIEESKISADLRIENTLLSAQIMDLQSQISELSKEILSGKVPNDPGELFVECSRLRLEKSALEKDVEFLRKKKAPSVMKDSPMHSDSPKLRRSSLQYLHSNSGSSNQFLMSASQSSESFRNLDPESLYDTISSTSTSFDSTYGSSDSMIENKFGEKGMTDDACADNFKFEEAIKNLRIEWNRRVVAGNLMKTFKIRIVDENITLDENVTVNGNLIVNEAAMDQNTELDRNYENKSMERNTFKEHIEISLDEECDTDVSEIDKNEKNCAMIQRALARRYKEERKREVKLKKDLKLLMKKVNELQSVAIDREKEYEKLIKYLEEKNEILSYESYISSDCNKIQEKSHKSVVDDCETDEDSSNSCIKSEYDIERTYLNVSVDATMTNMNMSMDTSFTSCESIDDQSKKRFSIDICNENNNHDQNYCTTDDFVNINDFNNVDDNNNNNNKKNSNDINNNDNNNNDDDNYNNNNNNNRDAPSTPPCVKLSQSLGGIVSPTSCSQSLSPYPLSLSTSPSKKEMRNEKYSSETVKNINNHNHFHNLNTLGETSISVINSSKLVEDSCNLAFLRGQSPIESTLSQMNKIWLESKNTINLEKKSK